MMKMHHLCRVNTVEDGAIDVFTQLGVFIGYLNTNDLFLILKFDFEGGIVSVLSEHGMGEIYIELFDAFCERVA